MADTIQAAMAVGQDFSVAAASYFGLDPDFLLEGSGVDGTAAAGGALRLTLVVALRPADVAGIAARMQELAAAAAVIREQVAEVTRQAIDAEYMWLADSYSRPDQKTAGFERKGRYLRIPVIQLGEAQIRMARHVLPGDCMQEDAD